VDPIACTPWAVAWSIDSASVPVTCDEACEDSGVDAMGSNSLRQGLYLLLQGCKSLLQLTDAHWHGLNHCLQRLLGGHYIHPWHCYSQQYDDLHAKRHLLRKHTCRQLCGQMCRQLIWMRSHALLPPELVSYDSYLSKWRRCWSLA